MHPVNKVLSLLGFTISRASSIPPPPEDFMRQYKRQLSELRKDNRGFKILKELYYDVGLHPQSYIDHECMFAARHISSINPTSILDVGSYRHFILGLLAGHKVTTLDIRKREPCSDNETVLICDAKQLDIPSNAFDAVLSLCALEHFGLGRYGDEFDTDADRRAFKEMVRVLRPDGRFIFTTTVSRAAASIVFNAHRIYDYGMIRGFCDGLKLYEEKFFSRKLGRYCSLEEVSNSPAVWDVYLGCWTKFLD